MAGKSNQRGFSFLFTLIFVALIAWLGLVVAQVFPTYLEYTGAVKAIHKAKEGATVQDVKNIFDKAAQIDDIRSITGKDLTITKAGDKVVVAFAYNKEIHMFGPAYVLMKYTGNTLNN
ncbi:DUF4845 domain-containing protein [Caenimonas sedimenti]|uniref:DUF4845 domain-containing protein n=1 Tax=Caenimonas sedimenti TaxID=2596921 RepID=A0A562ZKU5_9BURK|nr:DUF4845 domain-containing protein [Caenimonas sedimenti]TWO68938.1 DUF4845 domain-containing protein [Caenimonas sedimenti]